MPRAHVPHERMLAAAVHMQLEVVETGCVERGDNLHPCVCRHVWVLRAEDNHQAASDGVRTRRRALHRLSAPSAPLCSPVG